MRLKAPILAALLLCAFPAYAQVVTRPVFLLDCSIASLTGASQALVPQDMTRKFILIENIGNANIGVNPTGGTAAIGTAGTLTIAAGATQTFNSASVPGNAMTVIGTSAQPVTCVISQ